MQSYTPPPYPRRAYPYARGMPAAKRGRYVIPRSFPSSYGARRPYIRPTVSAVEVKSYDLQVSPDVNDSDSGIETVYVTAVAGIGATNAFTTGMSCINMLQQGATFYQRIGCKVSIKSIALEGVVALAYSSASTYPSCLRMLLIYDKQSNGAYPTVGDILQNNDSGVTTFDSGLNIQNRSRFSIIRDQRIQLDTGSQYVYPFKVFCTGKWDTEYGTNTGLIGDIKTGAIHVLIFQNWKIAFGASLGPVIGSVHSRIRYFD